MKNDFLIRHVIENKILYSIKDVLNAQVTDGNKIVVEPLTEETEKWKNFVYGSLFTAALNQRKKIIMHASAINFLGDKAAIFMADSGLGKSSIAYTLSSKSAKLISDDLVAIDPELDHPTLNIGTIKNKLLGEWAYKLGLKNIGAEGFQFDQKTRTKPEFIAEIGQYQIDKMFFLQINTNQTEEINLVELEPVETLMYLKGNMYKSGFVEDLQLEKLYFEYFTKIAKAIPAYLIVRNAANFEMDAMLEVINSVLIKSNS